VLPNFVVIGGMKCGTTALWHYLRMHPEIFVPPRRKNLYFFISSDNWSKGTDWYSSFFEEAEADAKAIGEISTEYTKYPSFRGVPQNMVSVLPNAKLIYLVRHPIRRIVSHYIHMVSAAKEARDIDNALENIEGNPYVCYSMYYLQLEQYLEYYQRDKVMVVASENLRQRPVETLRSIYRFLGVDEVFQSKQVVVHTRDEKRKWNGLGRVIRRSDKYFRLYNYYLSRVPKRVRPIVEGMFGSRAKDPCLSNRTRTRLRVVLRKDLEKLFDYVAPPFEMWNLEDF